MKLRNKKTGEIVELLARPSFVKRDKENFLASEVICFDSLAELNEEWEDYEDDDLTKIIEWIDKGLEDEILPISVNDFVEKLKAAKRLKDKGFRFDKWNNTSAGPYRPIWFYFEKDTMFEDIKSDLDLLFGGEE